MVTTLILSLALMAAFFLMLFAAVALVQDRRLFKSAPKDIQASVLEYKVMLKRKNWIGSFPMRALSQGRFCLTKR